MTFKQKNICWIPSSSSYWHQLRKFLERTFIYVHSFRVWVKIGNVALKAPAINERNEADGTDVVNVANLVDLFEMPF